MRESNPRPAPCGGCSAAELMATLPIPLGINAAGKPALARF